MKKFTEWLENDAEDCGICPSPMNAQCAVDILKDYLLGEDWYVHMPINIEQVNSEIVFDILMKYSIKFRKEWKRYCKKVGKSK